MNTKEIQELAKKIVANEKNRKMSFKGMTEEQIWKESLKMAKNDLREEKIIKAFISAGTIKSQENESFWVTIYDEAIKAYENDEDGIFEAKLENALEVLPYGTNVKLKFDGGKRPQVVAIANK